MRGLEPAEAEEARERLLSRFRWILVDEYQDINGGQYKLISALAGRTLSEPDARLSLFAVGDDDQNIYSFNETSVEYIRRFEAEYRARPAYLLDNYRSTGHIIDAANAVIAEARERMKTNHPIRVDRARAQAHAGGEWADLDPVGCRPGTGPSSGKRADLSGAGCANRVEAIVEPRCTVGLVEMRGDSPRVELPRPLFAACVNSKASTRRRRRTTL